MPTTSNTQKKNILLGDDSDEDFLKKPLPKIPKQEPELKKVVSN